MKFILLSIIRLYQATLSPDHGWLKARYPHGFCRFYPTCSQYAYNAVERFGVLRGSLLAVKRIMQCVPWAEPRIDQVPTKFLTQN